MDDQAGGLRKPTAVWRPGSAASNTHPLYAQLLHKVAPTGAGVLMPGQSGTGREVAARRIHRLLPHREGPFVLVNCGAIPAGLPASELLGHERGVFTGALRSPAGPRNGCAWTAQSWWRNCASTRSTVLRSTDRLTSRITVVEPRRGRA